MWTNGLSVLHPLVRSISCAFRCLNVTITDSQFSYQVVGGGTVEYRGEVRSTGSEIPHGRGVQILPDGAVYSGDFVDGKREGNGRLSTVSGDVYDGKWKNGQRHGHGVETDMTGVRYEGYWKNGRKVGRGRFKYADGFEQQVIVGKDGKLTVIR